MEGVPWTYKGFAIVLAPYDGFTIQIHDLLDGFISMLKPLASMVGGFIIVE